MDEQIGGTGGITDEQIRDRAYEISLGEDAGTAEDNWRRAEQELRGGMDAGAGGGYGDVGGFDDMSGSGDAGAGDMAAVGQGGMTDDQGGMTDDQGEGTGDGGAPEAGDQPTEDLPGAASP